VRSHLRALYRRALSFRRRDSALIVPVPEAEPLVSEWRRQFDPAAAGGMPAHLTLLYPFVPPRRLDAAVERQLADLFGAFEPFRFRLVAVARFPGVLYLAPEPTERFTRLTAAIERRWPEHPPYEGAFETVVPHLTVAQGEEPEGLEATLAQSLPIEAEAREAWLMIEGEDRLWSRRQRFSFGPTPKPEG
jgi:2'-5' RNA ligase